MKTIAASAARPELRRQAGGLRSGSFRPAFRLIGKVLRRAFARNFSQTASTAGPWPPRKNVGDGHPLLDDTGRLKAGATEQGAAGHIAEYGDRQMSEGIDGDVIAYAAAHNFGYPPRNLPERQFIDVDDVDLEECDEIIADYGLDLMGEASA